MWLSRYLVLFLANFFFIPEVLIRFENMDGRFFLTLFFFLGLNLSVSGLVYDKTVLTKKSVLGFLVGSFFVGLMIMTNAFHLKDIFFGYFLYSVFNLLLMFQLVLLIGLKTRQRNKR